MISNVIWCYQSMKKDQFDNDYNFLEDGRIEHCYDLSVKKYNLKKFVKPEDISDSEKKKIMDKCRAECSEAIVKKVSNILKTSL